MDRIDHSAISRSILNLFRSGSKSAASDRNRLKMALQVRGTRCRDDAPVDVETVQARIHEGRARPKSIPTSQDGS